MCWPPHLPWLISFLLGSVRCGLHNSLRCWAKLVSPLVVSSLRFGVSRYRTAYVHFPRQHSLPFWTRLCSVASSFCRCLDISRACHRRDGVLWARLRFTPRKVRSHRGRRDAVRAVERRNKERRDIRRRRSSFSLFRLHHYCGFQQYTGTRWTNSRGTTGSHPLQRERHCKIGDCENPKV